LRQFVDSNEDRIAFAAKNRESVQLPAVGWVCDRRQNRNWL
jgi:hypothetical protein